MRIIFAALLLPVAFASNGERGAVAIPESGGGAVPSSAVPLASAAVAQGDLSLEAAVERLNDLAVRRQSRVNAPDWSAVEEALDRLEIALTSFLAAESKGPLASGGPGAEGGLDPQILAVTLRDLAIGCSPRERDRLAARVGTLAALMPHDRDRRPLLRALVRIVEPIVLPTGAPRAAHTPLTDRAQAAVEYVTESLMDPLGVELPPFIVSTRQRVDDLRVGVPMPGFTARDVAGNELRSSELFGKVTLLRFWDPSSPASVAAHKTDAALVRDFWDTPFELVGVTLSTDRAGYVDYVASHDFAGLQLFDGPISAQLADMLAMDSGRIVSADSAEAPMGAAAAWIRPAPGAVFVIDAHGVLRGRDLTHGGIHALVSELVAEENVRRRGLASMRVRSR